MNRDKNTNVPRTSAGSCNYCEKKVLSYDYFGQSLSFHLDLPSKIGAFGSFVIFALTIAYMGYKISIVEAKKSVDILSAVNEDHFDNSYKFGAKQGLNIAVAVVNPFNMRPDPIIDPTYGRLRFSKMRWWPDGNDGFSYEWTELGSHPCSAEELGLSGTEHKFWPMVDSKRSTLEQFQRYSSCVDVDELEVYGTIGSVEGQVIDVDIVKCMGDDTYCKSDEEIKVYFASQ